MENQGFKAVVEVPLELLNKLERSADLIVAMSENAPTSIRQIEEQYLTPKEFMHRAKIGRAKFDEIKGRLHYKQVSPRKMMIPATDLKRWFNGEI